MDRFNRKEFIDLVVSRMTEGDDILPNKSYNIPKCEIYVDELIQQRPYTVVRLSCSMTVPPWTTVQGIGFTKVCHPDKWDAKYGKELAVRKAAAQVAKKIAWDWSWWT